MNHEIMIKINRIELHQNYPTIPIYYGKNEGMWGSHSYPKRLFFIKNKKNGFAIIFTNFKFHDIEKIDSKIADECELLYQSHSLSENMPHLIQRELFPIINELAPKFHYANLVLKRSITRDNDPDSDASFFGAEFFININKFACQYVSKLYFTNTINLVDSAITDSLGEEFIQLIDDASSIAACNDPDKAKRVLSIHAQNFGEELTLSVAKKCHFIYREMKEIFDPTDFKIELLKK